MIREEVQIGVSKTKITSESTIRICRVLFCINFWADRSHDVP